jgi:hypothetical protein
MPLRTLRAVLILWVFVPTSDTTAATILDEVAVRIYDTAGVAAGVRSAALRTAAATVASAGASIDWRICHGSDASCPSTPQPGELLLRIVHAPVTAASASSLARLRSAAGLPLGDAYVDVGQSAGVLATVYVDRVTRLAAESGTDVATLLGYAIAHEIGHLLMASNAHGTHGLMRPLWSSRELRQGRAADWTFAEGEAAAIRTRLEASRIRMHAMWGVR